MPLAGGADYPTCGRKDVKWLANQKWQCKIQQRVEAGGSQH